MNKFSVHWVLNGYSALNLMKTSSFDLCVLDVMMPQMDGFELAQAIVDRHPEIPFLFLTARMMKGDKIKGLKLGADDYIVKPFEADELVLRIHNILKRSSRHREVVLDQAKYNIGSYVFDTWRSELQRGEIIRHLTTKECDLIHYLYRHKNQLIKREQILKSIWKSDDFFSGRSMDVFISKIRKYFKDEPNVSIESVRGVGLEFKCK
ncbi:UNVERIFIED_CONTAM: hypothetical protein GTU68_037174 [Idotea baltica]|nr:hypothetical protein [Idotea baltica]